MPVDKYLTGAMFQIVSLLQPVIVGGGVHYHGPSLLLGGL